MCITQEASVIVRKQLTEGIAGDAF
jgi:hypothetical protein